MAGQKNIIYDSDHIRVVHQSGDPSRFALVTFSPATQFVNGSWFWADEVAAKSDLEAIGIVAKADNWFPVAEMQRASRFIRERLLGHKSVVGFGTSMGGYGVLRYGQLLGVTHALAFVPQWSIDPSDINAWDRRFVRHFDPSLHESVSIGPANCPKTTAIFYDPYMKLDRMNVERIVEASPHCIGIKSFFTGHSSVVTVKGTRSIMALFEALLEEDFKKIQSRANQARRDIGSGVRPLTLAKMMASQSIERALRIMEAHSDKLTTGQVASLHNDFACNLYNKGKYPDARRHSQIATETVFDVNFQIRLSMIEQKLGNREAALDIARDLVNRAPGNVGIKIHLAKMLADSGQKQDAIDVANMALVASPLSALALQLLVDLTEGEIRLAYIKCLCGVRPDFRSYILLGDALAQLGDCEQATDAYEAASILRPADPVPYQKIASMYLRFRKWTSAIGAARRAVVLAPENAACYLSLARALSGAGSSQAALCEAESALRLAPTHQTARKLCAELNRRLGRE